MQHKSVGSEDAAVLALLADTSRAGHGYGYGHGGSFGTFSSNAVRTDAVHHSVDRNGQDAHFFALSSEDRGHFNILNQQNQAFQIASQAQVSQLALQLCECCNDNKFEVGKIEGKLDCLGKEVALDILMATEAQTNGDLLGKIAVLQNSGNAAQSNDQHAQILAALGQIAGVLSGMDDDGGEYDGKRRRCRRCCKCSCRRCRCECKCKRKGEGADGDGINIRNIAISGNGNGPRGGGGGLEEEFEDENGNDDENVGNDDENVVDDNGNGSDNNGNNGDGNGNGENAQRAQATNGRSTTPAPVSLPAGDEAPE